MMNWHDTIHIKLQQQQAIHNYRQRHAVTHGNSRMLSYQNRRYINFASNDYLGLSRDVDVIKAWQNGAEYYGLGSGGSGHITGYSSVHKKLEAALADWLGYPQALLFNSGYAANQAAILSFMGAKDRILADKLCHASILEAAKLSPAYLRRFRHNNPASLTQFLTHSKQSFAKSLVITEGVFSMDGDMAPLNTLSSICQKQQSWLMVDDAHGIGAYGEQGRGSCSLYQIKPDLLIITFSKAFGLSGAAILCQNDTAQYLLQCARHLIYSTAMPIAQAYALVTALTKIQQADALREQLADNIGYFRRIGNGLPLSDSKTAIQPIILGDNTRTLRCVERLKTRGIWLTAIRPPTVPHGSARLRITLSAFHTKTDIEQLVEVLDEINNRI